MTAFILVLLCLVAVVFGALLVFRRGKVAPASGAPSSAAPFASAIEPDNLFIASASESAARSARVLPDGPSEDARHVLGSPPAPPPSRRRPEAHDFLPNPRAEWSVHVEFRDGRTVSRQQILEHLSPDWLRANGSPTVYGLSPEDGRWTFVYAADVPDTYTELQVAWRYLPLDPGLGFTFDVAERWLGALIAAVARIAPASVKPVELPAIAERRARDLEKLRDELLDAEITIGLVAREKEPFEGRALWDALTSLGLEWGDGDLFHWVNPCQESGDDSLFTVSTSTEPGYFFPEQAAEGRMRVEDLIFSMSVPRTHEPALVLEAMLRAAQYVQKRLGGTLSSAPADQPLDAEALRSSLEKTVQRMNTAGIRPGSEEACQLF